jgi:hypothetical protein
VPESVRDGEECQTATVEALRRTNSRVVGIEILAEREGLEAASQNAINTC